MRMNFGKMFVVAKSEPAITDTPENNGRVLPSWLKILPVIVVQGIVRHTNWVKPLNGTYSTPFVDVLMERGTRHNAP